jgi:hypothetical protein
VLPVSGPGKWKIYSSMKVFKHPPSIVIDEDRRALLLTTDHETMAIGRSIQSLRQPLWPRARNLRTTRLTFEVDVG